MFMKRNHFPLFLDVENKNVLVVGAGKIATRRIKTLLKFNLNITVIAPYVADEIIQFNKDGLVNLFNRKFVVDDLNETDIILLCTDDRNLNHEVSKISKSKNILTSVCDKKEECDFYFPAIYEDDDILIGMVGNGNDHKKVSDTIKDLKAFMEGKNEN